ncbi:MAG: hypothetical protein J0M09_16850 [Xanthomonadales bacterium]|nr:hypothetical protein [Xanthomonadales bacterium]
MNASMRLVLQRAMLVCALLSTWVSGLAQAQTQVWEGTLGKSSIVVKLDAPDDGGGIAGQYFYRKHRHGIDLTGARAADGSLALEEQIYVPGEDARSTWALKPASGDTVVGEWVGKGKRLPIRLRRSSSATLPETDDPGLAELRANDPYRFLQLHGMPLQAGKLETVGDYRLQWWREPISDVELFRVVSGYPAAQLPAVNLALARAHWKQVESFLDCTGAPLSDHESTTTLRYIGRDALSVSLFVSYYCGGAHPDFGDGPLNLDPRTGRELALEDVLWLGKGTPPIRGDDNNQAWYDYRNEVFAPWVAVQMSTLYPEEFSGQASEDCSYEMEDIWDFPTWHITEKGVYLGAIFPRVGRVCDNPEWSILPWAVVDKHHGAVRIKP